MTFRTLIVFCWVAVASAQQQDCTPVSGDHILGTDMAKALPAFARIPPDVPLAPAPAVNGSRVFSTSELETLARQFTIQAEQPEPVCFRLAMEAPSRTRILSAMVAALHDPSAQIQVLETGPEFTPHGKYEFRREGLSAPALPGQKTPVLWRGSVVYGENQSFMIWARVLVTAPVTRVEALEALRPGVPIQLSQLRIETIDGFPSPTNRVLTLDQVAGMAPIRNIAAGSEVRPENLTRPIDVARGAIVHVEARIGSARVALMARAEAAGRVGDVIPVRNTESSRVFSARVDGKDSVLVEAAPVLEH